MTRLLTALAATTALVLAARAPAQTMGGMHMPGMHMPMPAKKAPAKKPAANKPATATPTARPSAARRKAGNPAVHAMHGMTMPETPPVASPSADAMAAMPGMDMPAGQDGSDMSTMPGMTPPSVTQTGTALPAGNAAAPAPPMDFYADRAFPAAEMERARIAMMREQGGQTFYAVMFNLAEYQARRGRDGYRWDGEGWVGGDIDRLVIKTEGEGALRKGVDSAEVQALYSHAIGPYFNLQAGVRHDFQPSPARTYATIGFEGLAPYWFEVEGALFLSNKGDVLSRLEGYYDQRLTQRLVLQPRIELNLAAQDVPENRIGSGLTNAEFGLRLRYEIERQFAPYVGISYDRKLGDTARFARADGEPVQATSLVAGIKFWF